MSKKQMTTLISSANKKNAKQTFYETSPNLWWCQLLLFLPIFGMPNPHFTKLFKAWHQLSKAGWIMAFVLRPKQNPARPALLVFGWMLDVATKLLKITGLRTISNTWTSRYIFCMYFCWDLVWASHEDKRKKISTISLLFPFSVFLSFNVQVDLAWTFNKTMSAVANIALNIRSSFHIKKSGKPPIFELATLVRIVLCNRWGPSNSN